MTTEDAFLDDIRATPDEDAPRLIFADYLEDHGDPDRAEFIRTQIHLARRPRDSAEERATARIRCERLLQANWNRWVTPLAGCIPGQGPLQVGWAAEPYRPESSSHFRRGFVEVVESDGRLVAVASELFRRQPVRHLKLFQANDWADALAACPQLKWVESLTFADLYRAPMGPRGMFALRSSPNVERLRVLDLANNYLGDVGVAHLAEAEWLSRIARLELDDNGISSDGILSLARTKSALRPTHLSLSGNGFGDGGGVALAESPILSQVRVLALEGCGLTDETAAALARSPHFGSLEELRLRQNFGSDLARDLIDSAPWRPRLRNLYL